MKKVNLSFMAVMIISLGIILIMNAMAVFAYRDELFSLETRKDNMLSFNIRYNDLLEGLDSNARKYLSTNDEKCRSQFFSLRDSYLKSDAIPIDSRIFTEDQANESLKRMLSDTDFNTSSQVYYIQFNESERQSYALFLAGFRKLVSMLSDAVDEKASSVLTGPSLQALYDKQSQLMAGLTKSYIGRLNRQEGAALQRQQFLEYSLVVTSVLLLCFAAATFYMVLRENAFNSYFSKLYNTVVENIDGGIAILDKDCRFDYMNPKYREILGVPAGRTKGKGLREVFARDLADALENATADSASGEGKLDLMIGNRQKNIVYSYFTIDDERGNNKYVHLIRDITKTEELQLQLKKQLKEINFYSRAKDSFIANISHEIKTPINAILGMLHFLKGTRLSLNQEELVRKIETSSDILLTIISDVLDLSKIKSNTLSLYPSDFSLEAAIRNIEDMFSNQLAFNGIEWRTDYSFNRELYLHLDKTRFVQVLVNLLGNACKFTDSGYIKLSVKTLSEGEETVMLQFCVEDTGIGIAEGDISKLFREFEQLENHLTKQHQGTGLGLFICKNIIESMNGQMWVESVKDTGSRFFFSLPAKKALEQRAGDVENPFNVIPLNGRGARALVVEDTEINAEVTVKLLNDANIVCDTATDGTSAIEACRFKPSDYYNVILMDIHMPNMDGYTAAGILKKEIKVVSPIVALTASDINDQIRAKYAETIEAFILKPFKAAAFYKAISAYFPEQDKPALPRPEIKALRKPDEMGGADTAKAVGAAGKAAKTCKPREKRDPFAGREEAIRNLGGAESIYYKHVQKFKMNYADTAEHISVLLKEKNYEEARRLAHSVKGLGGTLGMLDVMETGAELEQAILHGEGYDLTVELENFSKKLRAAINAI